MPTSPTQQLASILLGEPVMTWVLARRAEGLSHRLVARALYNRTNGRIDVTHETIRNWIGAEAKAA